MKCTLGLSTPYVTGEETTPRSGHESSVGKATKQRQASALQVYSYLHIWLFRNRQHGRQTAHAKCSAPGPFHCSCTMSVSSHLKALSSSPRLCVKDRQHIHIVDGMRGITQSRALAAIVVRHALVRRVTRTRTQAIHGWLRQARTPTQNQLRSHCTFQN